MTQMAVNQRLIGDTQRGKSELAAHIGCERGELQMIAQQFFNTVRDQLLHQDERVASL